MGLNMPPQATTRPIYGDAIAQLQLITPQTECRVLGSAVPNDFEDSGALVNKRGAKKDN